MRKNIAAILPPVSSSTGTEHLDLATATELESLPYNESPTLDEYPDKTTLSVRVKKLLSRQGSKEAVYRSQNLPPLLDDSASRRLSDPTTTKSERRRSWADRPQKGRILRAPSEEPSTKRRRTAGPGGTLTAEQIREHLSGLRREAPGEIGGSDVSACSLCGQGILMLAPTPRYCSCCGAFIKSAVNYYRTEPPPPQQKHDDSEQHSFCFSCFKQSRGEIPAFGGHRIPKKRLVAAKNTEAKEEPWVQCDACDEWSHQICALYDNTQDKYICLNCRLKAMESQGYGPSSGGCTFPVATDLPQTALGNYIQHRLLRRMRQDREERAKEAGKSVDEVPGAEDLLVRVVLSMRKTLAANNNLLSVLQDKDYPTEFTYTTKMILMFQKIEGIDVCIFGMYVQEYGSDCKGPNHRYAYISYIDSAKYFRPDIKASNGEFLRTVAYHEILISYLDFVKKRGFATCYLWSCPPLKGDQYILNCHPDNQKTPKSDRLRQWYVKMLKKAIKEGIVVHRTTLYDRFCVATEGPGCKITAARLPYFEGDYWPGVVENLLKDIENESKEYAKKGAKRTLTKTCLKVLGLKNPSDATNKDTLLIRKFGQAIASFKEDFMVIDLQHACAHCHEPILSGKRWVKADARNCYLCERCHDDLDEDDKDSVSQYEVVDNVPSETEDQDGILENDICESRQKFLMFCQEKRYQFDTLRRTKHSSMMILHHIRPTARSKAALSEKESCDGCVQKSELLEILRHTMQCRPEEAATCDYRGCRSMQAMFAHPSKCDIKADGGCLTCQKVWYMLRSHSEQCTKPNCIIPFCKELKRRKTSVTKPKLARQGINFYLFAEVGVAKQ